MDPRVRWIEPEICPLLPDHADHLPGVVFRHFFERDKVPSLAVKPESRDSHPVAGEHRVPLPLGEDVGNPFVSGSRIRVKKHHAGPGAGYRALKPRGAVGKRNLSFVIRHRRAVINQALQRRQHLILRPAAGPVAHQRVKLIKGERRSRPAENRLELGSGGSRQKCGQTAIINPGPGPSGRGSCIFPDFFSSIY